MSTDRLSTHHPDCDGWRQSHRTVMEQTSRQGRGMWQARCEECDWLSSTVGPQGRSLVARQEAEHGNVWTQCVGECSAWSVAEG